MGIFNFVFVAAGGDDAEGFKGLFFEEFGEGIQHGCSFHFVSAL